MPVSADSLVGLTLVIPDKPDVERDAVAAAWEVGGGGVLRLGRFWEPPELEATKVRIYGNDTFGLVLAQKLGLELISPPDDLLAAVPTELLKRDLNIQPLNAALAGDYPKFIKPVVPKQFGAAVWASREALKAGTKGLEDDTLVYAAEPVDIDAEVRCFILDGAVITAGLYEGTGNIEEAVAVAGSVAKAAPVPDTCVLDIGHIAGRGWALVEANASWGAGLNGCAAENAVMCITRACRPLVAR